MDHIGDFETLGCEDREAVRKRLFPSCHGGLELGKLSMGVEGDGSGGGRLKGKAKQLDEGPSVDAAVLLPHSDSLGSTANPGVKDKESGMLKTVARDLLSERRDPRVLQEALSRLQQVFPHVCRHAAAADLSSQLSRTSPGTAFERIKTRYLERGVPKAEVVAQEKPKPGKKIPGDAEFRVRALGMRVILTVFSVGCLAPHMQSGWRSRQWRVASAAALNLSCCGLCSLLCASLSQISLRSLSTPRTYGERESFTELGRVPTIMWRSGWT